jgi:hypothetical protein
VHVGVCPQHAALYRALVIIGTPLAVTWGMASKKTPGPGVRTTAIASDDQVGRKKTPRDTHTLLSRARKEADRLADEVRRLRNAFDAYVGQTSKELRVSQQEIERLARRVHRLEQVTRPRVQIDTQARLPASPAKSLFTFLGRPSQPSLS